MKLLSTGNEKLQFTMILSCLADGTKLCSYLVFKRKTMPSETVPEDVVVRVNQKGYMTDDMVVEWYRLAWLLRPVASLKDHTSNLLV